MKQIIHILIFCLCIVCGTDCIAQHQRGKDWDKIEQLRVTFITKKLELTSAEGEKFWPVYTEYNEKMRAIKKNLRQSYRKKTEGLTDADAEELYQLDLKTKQTELDLHKQYSQRLKEIIGVRKLVLLHAAEEQFKREMISSIQHDKNE